jgi:hypothetical protein
MIEASTTPAMVRRRFDFLSVDETAALVERGISVLDPRSTLIATNGDLKPGTVLWPETIVDIHETGAVSVCSGSILFPGTRFVANGGRVTIGRDAEIGEEGGFTIRADAARDSTSVGDGARLMGGGSTSLYNRIGRSAQIIGAIRAQHCRLGDGGTYRDQDPDSRGGGLKGHGVARDIDVPCGHVIQSFGMFAEAEVRRQSFFHPPPVVPTGADQA